MQIFDKLIAQINMPKHTPHRLILLAPVDKLNIIIKLVFRILYRKLTVYYYF